MDGKFICYGAYSWSKGQSENPLKHGMELYDYTQNVFRPYTASGMYQDNERFMDWPWKHLVIGRGQLSNDKETIPITLNIINDFDVTDDYIPF